MKWILGIVALVAVAAAGLLAYGYSYASSHGALSMFVDDISDPQRSHPIVPVELSFLDASGAVLATAAGTDPSGGIFLTSPQEYACHAVEERAAFDAVAREAWQRCFEAQSRWVPTWIRRARSVDVRTARCSLPRVPLSFAEYRGDWWLWWAPLRHGGGKPYTLYSVSLQIDDSACRPRG